MERLCRSLYILSSKLVLMELHLASMENISCWAFRSLCVGATDSYTGMLSMNYLVRRKAAWKEVDTFEIEKQRQWIQVATSKEKECVEFIKQLNSELKENPAKDNVYGIQLNASCPSPQIIRVGQGPALIKRPTKVGNLLKELLKQDKFKIGIKVRLGLNPLEVQQRKVLSLFEEIEKINDSNFAHVTVHFKNALDKSSTPYDYSLLKEMKSFKIPLIINGGIKRYEDFERITKNVGAKNIVGFMVGREALQNPDALIDINRALGGESPSLRGLKTIGEEFERLCKGQMPKPSYLEKIKKYCSWYPKGLAIPKTLSDSHGPRYYG